MTGTMGGLAPVTALDGRTIGGGSPGPVTGRLTELFAELTARARHSRSSWSDDRVRPARMGKMPVMTKAPDIPSTLPARRRRHADGRVRHLAAARLGRRTRRCWPRWRAGYRHIDTATMYGNEAEVGHALRDSGLDRRRGVPHHQAAARQGRPGAADAAASLRALGTDYVDLWLVHWPPAARALRRCGASSWTLRDEGMARAVGVSNYSLAQIDTLISRRPARHRPSTRSRGARPATTRPCWRPAGSGRGGRGVQPAQGHQPGRPGAGRDRRRGTA